jgi:uncharacterized membrane protein
VIKLTTFGVHLSDTNVYFYTAYQMIHGKILYKDIFFTDFPLFPYISSLYFLVTNGNIQAFYLTSVIETIVGSFLIFYFSFSKTKSYLIATLSQIIYLFSFIILSTTDHQTGVFIGSVFLTASFIFFDKKRFVWAGIFIAFALLIKAYFLAILISYILYLILKKQYKDTLTFIIAGAVTGLVVLLPSLFFAFQELFHDVFLYSLTRGQGVSKMGVGQFFIMHDPLLFIILIWNLFNFRKNLLLSFISLFSILFFFIYQDIYYLYLNLFIPILVLSFADLYSSLQTKLPIQKMVLPTLIILFCLLNLGFYFSGYNALGKVTTLSQMTQTIKSNHPQTLYGVSDITPALAYLSQTSLVDNVIDTNANIFKKGIFSKEKLTHDALSKKSIIVTEGAYYPSLGVQEFILNSDSIDKKIVIKNCSLLQAFPIRAEGYTNRINLFKCY